MTDAVEAPPGHALPRRSLFAWLREGSRHQPGGIWGAIIAVGSVAAALYVIWIGALAGIIGDAALSLAGTLKDAGLPYLALDKFSTWARSFTAQYHLDISIFIAITFPIAFLTTTARRGRKSLAWTDIALAAISFAVAIYYIVLNDKFLNWSRGFDQPTLADTVAGLIVVFLTVELCRRSTGPGLTVFILLMLAYTFFGHLLPGVFSHHNFTMPYFIEMMTIMNDGIFGSPLEVASSYVLLFVLFGSFYHHAGGGQLFYDLASALTGRMRGGAAKACISASALYGSVSGSPTADVATTGPLTIPIMKRTGVSPVRAGAIEATASTGGAILPPVMGAVAFIMSDLTNIPYDKIAWAATLPSILYYVSLYLLVHIDAIRYDEGRIPEKDIVSLLTALRRGWMYFLPLAAMIALLVDGYTPTYVAAGSTLAVIVLSWLTPRRAIGPRRFVVACVETIAQLVPLIGAVAGAGLLLGCLEISGLAGKFQILLFSLSFGELVPTLILAGGFLIVLGMGMPTVAVYTLGVALLGPILIGKFGLQLMATHLFLVFYATLSAITPPVAVANFAAGAIAGANPMALGPYACKLTVGGFIVPFFFLFNHGVLMQGGAFQIVEHFVIGGLMVAFASLALHGWWGRVPIPRWARGVLGACSLAMIHPADFVQLPATAIGAAILLAMWKLLAAPAAPQTAKA
ncbi:MAG TPA: TRAP transporter fused permease subunit [Alphaproteobacteria bacterium]|jgi:TRAP transporter 4TM/12TM fusion protein